MTDGSPAAAPDRSLGRRVASGAAWVTLETWSQQLLQFLVFVVLSRLLGPEAYGMISLALIVNVVGEVVIMNGGWIEALVRQPHLDARHKSAVFWLLLAVGSALAVVASTLAAPLSALFDQPAMATLMPALALALPLTALTVVPTAVLRRELRFAPLAFASMTALGLASLAAVTLAVAGAGVWSLVAQQLLQPLVATILLWPRVRFGLVRAGCRGALRDILPFVAGTFSARLIGVADVLAVRLMIGGFLGTVALGHYAMARKVNELLVQLVSRPLGRVLLPAAALLGNDRQRLARLVAACAHVIGLGTFPAALGLLVLAPDCVRLVFGEAWVPSVPLLQLLLLSALVSPFLQLSGSLVYAAGRAGLQAALAALSTSLLVGLLLILGVSTLLSVGIALLARSLLMLPLRLVVAKLVSGIDVPRLCAGSLPSLGVAILMAGAVWWLRHGLPDSLPLEVSVALMVVAGGGIYLALTFLLAREALRQVSALHRHLRSSSSPRPPG